MKKFLGGFLVSNKFNNMDEDKLNKIILYSMPTDWIKQA